MTSPSPTNRPWGPLIAISMVMFIVALDATMLNVAIPDIVRDLDTNTSSVQSAISLYSLVMAALMVGAGRLADLLGSKKVYVAGLVVFGAGTLTASLAPNVGVLIVGWSFLEGIGAAALIPLSLALVSTNYAGKQRAIAFGVIGGFQAVAAAMGPIIGGYLATELSWRYAFGFEAGIVVVVLVMTRLLAGAEPRPGRTFDLVGLGLWASGLVTIVLGVLLAGHYGWWDARRTFSLLGMELAPGGISPTPLLVLAGLLILLGFVHWSRRRLETGLSTLFAFSTFKSTNFKAGIATDSFESLLIAGMLFIIPVYLQSAHAYTALEAGVALLPFSIAILVASLGFSRLGDRLPARPLIQAGSVVIGIGLIWYRSVADSGLQASDLIAPFVILGLGIGTLLSRIANITLANVPESESGSATGIYNTGKELGTSLGTAIIGTAMLASFFGFFVDSTALVAGAELSPTEATELAIALEDAETSFDEDEFNMLLESELPEEALSDIDRIVEESWTNAHRRALESALVVVVLTFISSTFLKGPRNQPAPTLREGQT